MKAEDKPGLQPGIIGRLTDIPFLIPHPLLFAGAVIPAGFFIYDILPVEYTAYRPLIGAIFFSLGTIFDKETTVRSVIAITRLEQQTGIESPFKELGEFVSDRPTRRELYSLPQIIRDAFLCSASIFFPAFGVAIGSLRLYASLNNHWVRILHERKLKEIIGKPVNPS